MASTKHSGSATPAASLPLVPQAGENPPTDTFEVCGLRMARATPVRLGDDFSSIRCMLDSAVAILARESEQLSVEAFGALYLLETANGALVHLHNQLAAAARGAA